MKARIAHMWARQLLGNARISATARPTGPILRSVFTSTTPSARCQFSTRSLEYTSLRFLRYQRAALSRRFRSLRFKSDKPNPQSHNPTPHLGSPEPAPSVSQRLRQLSKEYGWTAVGVYFGLSLLDFPFCFLAVRLLGTDRIGHYEEAIKDAFWSVVRLAIPGAGTMSTEKQSKSDLAEAAAEQGTLGSDGVALRVDNGSNACEYRPIPFLQRRCADRVFSHLESTRPGLSRAQISNLLSSPSHCSSTTESRQDSKKMGI